jgi:hypothetical protein
MVRVGDKLIPRRDFLEVNMTMRSHKAISKTDAQLVCLETIKVVQRLRPVLFESRTLISWFEAMFHAAAASNWGFRVL